MGITLIVLAVIGLTEFAKRLEAKDWKGAGIIVAAAVIGALVAVFDDELGVQALTVAQGVEVGLGAVGIHTAARQIG